jgi:hypothetical protein
VGDLRWESCGGRLEMGDLRWERLEEGDLRGET